VPRIEASRFAQSPASPGPKPARFDVAERIKTKVAEASDVVALPGGRFLVVGDTSDKVSVLEADGSLRRLELPNLGKGASQLGGAAYDPLRHHLLLSREEKRELVRYEWNPDTKQAPKLEKRFSLEKLGGPRNKGIEGLAYLQADFSPTGKAQLLAANEGNPRELMVLDDGGGGKPLAVKLEKQVRDVLRDFSAVAIDPKTGNVFLSSDESSTVAQVRLVRDGDTLRGQLVQSFPLRDPKGKPLERVEGLAFNDKGDLFVLTENDGVMHKLARR
jgi:SdiA-regulated